MLSSSHLTPLTMLNYVRKLLPEDAAVLLVGNCEFGSVEVLKWLDRLVGLCRWTYYP
jgi:hypothetical protein